MARYESHPGLPDADLTIHNCFMSPFYLCLLIPSLRFLVAAGASDPAPLLLLSPCPRIPTTLSPIPGIMDEGKNMHTPGDSTRPLFPGNAVTKTMQIK